MKKAFRRNSWMSAITACRVALAKGFLVKFDRHYRYVPPPPHSRDTYRLFRGDIVCELIRRGEAFRVGDRVVSAQDFAALKRNRIKRSSLKIERKTNAGQPA